MSAQVKDPAYDYFFYWDPNVILSTSQLRTIVQDALKNANLFFRFNCNIMPTPDEPIAMTAVRNIEFFYYQGKNKYSVHMDRGDSFGVCYTKGGGYVDIWKGTTFRRVEFKRTDL